MFTDSTFYQIFLYLTSLASSTLQIQSQIFKQFSTINFRWRQCSKFSAIWQKHIFLNKQIHVYSLPRRISDSISWFHINTFHLTFSKYKFICNHKLSTLLDFHNNKHAIKFQSSPENKQPKPNLYVSQFKEFHIFYITMITQSMSRISWWWNKYYYDTVSLNKCSLGRREMWSHHKCSHISPE